MRTDPGASRPTDDAALAVEARRGDHDAFRVLYERYAGPVLGLLIHRLRDRGLAEDALQEAFTKAFRALGVYDERRPFGPWIVAIAENVARDARRRRGPGVAVQGDAQDAPVVADDQVAVATRREGEETVRAALAALPAEPRAVLVLRYHRGLTQRDVADHLGCSLRTVQTREAEALALLARLLDARRKADRREAT